MQRNQMRWAKTAGLVLLLAAGSARDLAAQRVDGQIRDAETRAPLSGATLQLVDAQGQAVQGATSDGRGLFTLRAPAPGLYRIRASRIGYREGTSQPLDLRAAGELDVDLRLSTDAVQLEPLTVTGIPRNEILDQGGFYERRSRFGPDGLNEAVFLEQHDIERLNPFSVADIFRNVRGVRAERGAITMHGGCSPAVVINGFLARAGRSNTSYSSINRHPPLARREIPTPRVLAGVEVYYGTAIPERYLVDSGGCGVILYWTK